MYSNWEWPIMANIIIVVVIVFWLAPSLAMSYNRVWDHMLEPVSRPKGGTMFMLQSVLADCNILHAFFLQFPICYLSNATFVKFLSDKCAKKDRKVIISIICFVLVTIKTPWEHISCYCSPIMQQTTDCTACRWWTRLQAVT